MEIKERVIDILNQNFSPSEISIEGGDRSKRISGYIVSDAFAGLDDLERQQQLRIVLKKELGDKSERVSTILVYTTAEYKVMSAA